MVQFKVMLIRHAIWHQDMKGPRCYAQKFETDSVNDGAHKYFDKYNNMISPMLQEINPIVMYTKVGNERKGNE